MNFKASDIIFHFLHLSIMVLSHILQLLLLNLFLTLQFLPPSLDFPLQIFNLKFKVILTVVCIFILLPLVFYTLINLFFLLVQLFFFSCSFFLKHLKFVKLLIHDFIYLIYQSLKYVESKYLILVWVNLGLYYFHIVMIIHPISGLLFKINQLSLNKRMGDILYLNNVFWEDFPLNIGCSICLVIFEYIHPLGNEFMNKYTVKLKIRCNHGFNALV